jgi:hypothetical protein
MPCTASGIEVLEDEIARVAFQPGQRLRRRRDAVRGPARLLEEQAERGQHRGVVVGDEDHVEAGIVTDEHEHEQEHEHGRGAMLEPGTAPQQMTTACSCLVLVPRPSRVVFAYS